MKILNILLRTILNIICVLLVFTPIATIYASDYNGEINYKEYVFSNMLVSIIIATFYMLWIVYQFVKLKRSKLAVVILLILISGLISSHSFMTLSMPIQDYIPELGSLFTLSFFPMIIAVIATGYLAKKRTTPPISSRS